MEVRECVRNGGELAKNRERDKIGKKRNERLEVAGLFLKDDLAPQWGVVVVGSWGSGSIAFTTRGFTSIFGVWQVCFAYCKAFCSPTILSLQF